MRPVVLALITAFAAVPALGQPQDEPSLEVRLDLDGDGRRDLARIVTSGTGDPELHIYYGMGDATPDAGRKADVIATNIVSDRFVGLLAPRGRSLVVTGSCGGCSQSAETKLTIVHRGGRLIVAGLEIDWEFRDEGGRCSINFLTGRGEISKSPNGRPQPIRTKLAAVPLAQWDFDKGKDSCFPAR